MNDNTSDLDDGDDIIVENSGFEQVPSVLYLDAGISDGAVRMWIILSDRGGTESRAVPKRKTLAKMIGAKSPRSVDSRLEELQARGWLLVTPRFRDDEPGMTSNRYTLLRRPITSEDDPRLVKHRRAVAAFAVEMDRRKAANAARKAAAEARRMGDPSQNSATPPLAESCEGGSQQDATPPSQKVAHQESDLCTDPDSSGSTNTPPRSATEASDGDASTLFGESPPAEAPPPQPPSFDDFYAKYPRKEARGDAVKAWGQVVRAGAAPAEVTAGLDRYLAEINRKQIERKYVKLPASWLRAQCWLDEYDEGGEVVPMTRRVGWLADQQAMKQGWLEQGRAIDRAIAERTEGLA